MTFSRLTFTKREREREREREGFRTLRPMREKRGSRVRESTEEDARGRESTSSDCIAVSAPLSWPTNTPLQKELARNRSGDRLDNGAAPVRFLRPETRAIRWRSFIAERLVNKAPILLFSRGSRFVIARRAIASRRCHPMQPRVRN